MAQVDYDKKFLAAKVERLRDSLSKIEGDLDMVDESCNTLMYLKDIFGEDVMTMTYMEILTKLCFRYDNLVKQGEKVEEEFNECEEEIRRSDD